MKYRILYKNGLYYPQWKSFLFWRYYWRGTYSYIYRVGKEDIKDAERFIEEQREQDEKMNKPTRVVKEWK